MSRWIFLILWIGCKPYRESVPIDWTMLKKTTFVKKQVEGTTQPIDFPIFPEEMQRLAGKWVQIRGYVIPVEETGDSEVLVLSAYPYSNCFFCGKAGAESIMDIRLKNKLSHTLRKDQTVTFMGKLRLNDSDLMYFNYILDDAEIMR